MRTTLRLGILCAAIALGSAANVAVRQGESGDAIEVACRVLEAHSSANPAVTAVVFHQQKKEDQERLAELLRGHSGEGAEVQIGSGEPIGGTVFRLKSCFGRGLLLLPPGAQLKDGSTFLLRFAATTAKDQMKSSGGI